MLKALYNFCLYRDHINNASQKIGGHGLNVDVLPSVQIKRSYVLAQHHPGRYEALREREMQRKFVVCVRYRTHYCKLGVSDKIIIAYHQSGSVTRLFVPLPRVEAYLNDIALPYHISLPTCSPQLISSGV